MSQSEARMPCHLHFPEGLSYENAQKPGTAEHVAPQCAGRAIHWANQAKRQLPGSGLLELDPDPDTVFTWSSDFVTHHTGNAVGEHTVPKQDDSGE